MQTKNEKKTFRNYAQKIWCVTFSIGPAIFVLPLSIYMIQTQAQGRK